MKINPKYLYQFDMYNSVIFFVFNTARREGNIEKHLFIGNIHDWLGKSSYIYDMNIAKAILFFNYLNFELSFLSKHKNYHLTWNDSKYDFLPNRHKMPYFYWSIKCISIVQHNLDKIKLDKTYGNRYNLRDNFIRSFSYTRINLFFYLVVALHLYTAFLDYLLKI